MEPRTGDLRREAEDAKNQDPKKQKRATRATWAERRKAAKARKTGTVTVSGDGNVDKKTRTVITDKQNE